MKILTCVSALLLAIPLLAQNSNTKDPVETLRHDFVYGTLVLSPTTATTAGYHRHNGRSLDAEMDDVSPAGLSRQREFYRGIGKRAEALRANSKNLSPEDVADLRIISDAVGAALFDLDDAQTYAHNPTAYVELIGNALYSPSILDYAPSEQRYRDILSRLKAAPGVIEAARTNLKDSPEVWNTTARDENEGNIGLIQQLQKDCPAPVKKDFDTAAETAIQSLRGFNEWLKTDLSKHTSDWRLGKARYAKKFRYVLDVGATPEETLAAAEAEITRIKGEMQKLAGDKSIKQALDDIAAQHATPANYMQSAEDDLKQATEFVRDKHLVAVPDTSNLKVIETPEFMRGAYGVGGFNPAPVLQPNLQASFWVTPLSPDAQRAESKLREYNKFGLQHLVVHEAMPGHWLQFQYASKVQPESRRVLRSLFGNGPYVEGWAVYTQQFMADAGYMAPETGFKMTFYKQMLRVLTNTVLDIKLQTQDMTDEQAMKLMTEDAFQEKEEAVLKLRRAKLSQVQLCMYFVGWRGWNTVRNDEEKRLGGKFSLEQFHERALDEGAVPIAALPKLLEAAK